VHTVEGLFTCSDGTTVLPYRVCSGAATASTSTTTSTTARYCNFVVVHDIFDSLAKTQLLLAPVLRSRAGCTALLFAYPGQADTATSSTSSSSSSAEQCNNTKLAPLLHELLQHVHLRGYMSSSAPLHLVGIGTGALTALAFAAAYCHTAPYGTTTNSNNSRSSSSSSSSSAVRGSLQSVVCLNGCAAVDAQLSAVLHATAAAFAALPHDRPELAASYFARFALGEEVSFLYFFTGLHCELQVWCCCCATMITHRQYRTRLCRQCCVHALRAVRHDW
jgi:hypothetical protein